MIKDGIPLIIVFVCIALWLAYGAGVNPFWFGAQCDGLYDDTVAFNRAVYFARAIHKSVVVPDNCVVNYLKTYDVELKREGE